MVHQNPDPYTVLGVTPTATSAQITHAYRTQLRALHPDTRITPAQANAVGDAQLRQVLAAYAQLRHLDHQTDLNDERTAERTPPTQAERSDSLAQSLPTPKSAPPLQIPVTRHGEHSHTRRNQHPLLWAGPVRRHH
jgi:curved DNA-binding protein CbpA